MEKVVSYGGTGHAIGAASPAPTRDQTQLDQIVDELRSRMAEAQALHGRTADLACRLRGNPNEPMSSKPASAPTPVPLGHLAAIRDFLEATRNIQSAHNALLNELDGII